MRIPLHALPISCPRGRATNIYRFDHLIAEPRPMLSRNPARTGTSLPKVTFVDDGDGGRRPSRRR